MKGTRAMMNALSNGSSRAPAMAQEIMLAVYVKIHQAHPCYSHLYAVLTNYRRHILRCPGRIITHWRIGSVHGIAGTVAHLCEILKLDLTSNGIISNRLGDSIDIHQFVDEAADAWAHRARQCFRRHELAALEVRRPGEFTGIIDADLVQIRKCAGKIRDPLASEIVRRYIGGGIMTRDRFSRHTFRGHRYMCDVCGAPETTHHILWECPLFAQHRQIGLHQLPVRPCVPAVGAPAMGEMTDALLTSLYGQVADIVLAYQRLRPKNEWRAQVAPVHSALATCQIRLRTKTAPPLGGWQDPPSMRTPCRIDHNGHTVQSFVNAKGNEAIRCATCRREMLARAI
eukprot:1948920-Amphidinium_carterae.1